MLPHQVTVNTHALRHQGPTIESTLAEAYARLGQADKVEDIVRNMRLFESESHRAMAYTTTGSAGKFPLDSSAPCSASVLYAATHP